MAIKQLERYGWLAVGMRVQYLVSSAELGDGRETARTDLTITAILEQSLGVMVTLKGTASTLVQAFNSDGIALNGAGRLKALAG